MSDEQVDVVATSPTLEIDDAYLFETYFSRVRADPLASFRCISEGQRAFLRWVREGEALLRAGNGSGKTWVGAALAVALCRGLETLDGIPLPRLPIPCVGWCLVQTYKAQVDAAQKAVLHWLGDWPHKIVYVSGSGHGYAETIWIATDQCKHPNDERCETCSRLVFHVVESQSGVGGRADFVWADEPPLWEVWDEFRQRGGAGDRLTRFITATPKERKFWWWMADPDKGFVGCEDRLVNGLVEVRSTLRDNTALSAEALADKLAMAEKSPLRDAILNGDYVDLAGDCPFDLVALETWMRRTRPPKRTEILECRAEQQSAQTGAERLGIRCAVEIYHDVEPDEVYLGILDPSMFMLVDPVSGVIARDASKAFQRQRDHACLHVLSRRRPRLCARFIGYCGSYGLGSLAAQLAQRYNQALVDVDTTGGYGLATIRALTEANYYYFNRETHADTPGNIASGLGFKITRLNRAEMTDAIQQALIEDSIEVASEEVVRSLMNITVQQTAAGNDRWVASHGSQDHDMICLGRGLHLMETLPSPPPLVSNGDRLRLLSGMPRAFQHRRAVRRPGPRWNP